MSFRFRRVVIALLGLFTSGAALNQYGCTTLYDPYGYGYNAMQDVIGYRQDVMDWSNDAWDEYIRQ